MLLKMFSPIKSSEAADFDCLLTMNDSCNEINHCSVRMMMVIKLEQNAIETFASISESVASAHQ